MRAWADDSRRLRPSDISRLNRLLDESPQLWRTQLESGRWTYRVVPQRNDWSALKALLVLSFVELISNTDSSRLKRCANPKCSYLFYDGSTNRSRRWCFSTQCGNVMHVSAFRARQAGSVAFQHRSGSPTHPHSAARAVKGRIRHP